MAWVAGEVRGEKWFLKPDSLEPAQVFSYGGFGFDVEVLAAKELGRQPTAEELTVYRARATSAAGVGPGTPWWLSPEGTRAVLALVEPHIEGLRKRKASEQT